jgi:hypothetical protein
MVTGPDVICSSRALAGYGTSWLGASGKDEDRTDREVFAFFTTKPNDVVSTQGDAGDPADGGGVGTSGCELDGR